VHALHQRRPNKPLSLNFKVGIFSRFSSAMEFKRHVLLSMRCSLKRVVLSTKESKQVTCQLEFEHGHCMLRRRRLQLLRCSLHLTEWYHLALQTKKQSLLQWTHRVTWQFQWCHRCGLRRVLIAGACLEHILIKLRHTLGQAVSQVHPYTPTKSGLVRLNLNFDTD